MNDEHGTLYVRNEDQRVLFEQELRGQLSDGHWENTMPLNHWRPWSDCAVVVAAPNAPTGRTFGVSRKHYRIASRELLDVVEPRMLRLVRLARVYGAEDARRLVTSLWDELGCGDWRGTPQHAGDYWDQERAFLMRFPVYSQVRQLGEDRATYGFLQLLRDLLDLQRAMATRLSPEELALLHGLRTS